MDLSPRPTGRTEAVSLTGCLLPWNDGFDQPVLLTLIGSDAPYMAVFSTEAMLQATMARANVPFDRIKLIGEHWEFIDSIPDEILIIKDPWYTLEGKIRFMQVQR